jgi:cobalt/nickel transport protein
MINFLVAATAGGPASAHFQELIPSTDIVAEDTRAITIDAVFTHPFDQGPAMAMDEPVRFGVLVGGRVQDLRSTLEPLTVDGQPAFRTRYTVERPGDHVFFLEPAAYWEAAERVMIVHYTKVVVDAFGAEDGWDAMVGFPVEIEPLVRPYGLWTGNVFRGLVRSNGAPVPFATVEVEWRNDGSVRAPADPFITQTIKSDGGGVFAYAMPRAGWWGFAALVAGERPIKNPNGESVPVEQGGLMWVRVVDMR